MSWFHTLFPWWAPPVPDPIPEPPPMPSEVETGELCEVTTVCFRDGSVQAYHQCQGERPPLIDGKVRVVKHRAHWVRR